MNAEDTPILVYDGECPFCSRYVRMLRLRKSVGGLQLVDAREPGALREYISSQGLDIDQGMVLKLGSRLYHGADAMHVLALMSSRSGLFNRINYWLFRSDRLSRLLYPLLRTGRNLVLKCLGKSRINNLNRPGNQRF